MSLTLKNNVLKNSIFILLILFLEYIFFDNVLFNDSLIGNYIDGKLNMLFTEHWYQVFCGNDYWKDLPCFFPEKNVLSYSDIMLGFSLPYSIFRIIGINMFSAFKYSLILVHVIGSIALYYFVNKCLNCSSTSAFLATLGFSFSSGYYYVVTNPQMIALSFLPIILVCLYYYIKNYENNTRHLFALIGLSVFILIFYTAFYVAYFSFIFLILFAIFFLVISLISHPKKSFILLKSILTHCKDYICYVIFGILLMIPFIDLYLPALQTLGGRDWSEILLFTPNVYNLLNLEISNPLGFDLSIYPRNFGFSPIILLLYVISFIGYIVYIFKNKSSNLKEVIIRNLIISFCLTLILSFFLAINWDGFSLWYYIYKLIPGASAIRVLERWPVFIVLPFSILFAYIVDFLLKNHIKIKNIALPILILIIYACNYSEIGICTDWNASEEIAFLEHVAAPPKDCQVMYITDKSKVYINEAFANEDLQVNAWMIAQTYGIKTVNGYSGQVPNGWNISSIADDNIDQKVVEWLQAKDVTDISLYSYDIGTNTWTKHQLD